MKTLQELNELKDRIHEQNRVNWWQDAAGNPIDRNKYELLMLVISEIAEGMEGTRKDLMDDKLPHRKMEEVEMADAAIRLLDYSAGFSIELIPIYSDGTEIEELGNKGQAMFCISSIVCKIPKSGQYLSGALGMIEAYCKHFKLDLWGAVEEKLEYNKTRADHKHEIRAQQGGKKF